MARGKTNETASLGDLIVAVFDEAARYSTNPREVSRLARRAIGNLVRRGRRQPRLPLAPTGTEGPSPPA
jgi:hypothetical protein